jgi:hypothetical protein
MLHFQRKTYSGKCDYIIYFIEKNIYGKWQSWQSQNQISIVVSTNIEKIRESQKPETNIQLIKTLRQNNFF